MMQTDTPPSATQFDWQLYADATFAGLSLLIPMPLLDVVFEWFSGGGWRADPISGLLVVTPGA